MNIFLEINPMFTRVSFQCGRRNSVIFVARFVNQEAHCTFIAPLNIEMLSGNIRNPKSVSDVYFSGVLRMWENLQVRQ